MKKISLKIDTQPYEGKEHVVSIPGLVDLTKACSEAAVYESLNKGAQNVEARS